MVGDFEKIDTALGQILADLHIVKSSQGRVEEWFGHHGQYSPDVQLMELGALQQSPPTRLSYGQAEDVELMRHHESLKSSRTSANTQDPVVWEHGTIFSIANNVVPSAPCHPLRTLTVAFADGNGAKYLKKSCKEDLLYTKQESRTSGGSKRFSMLHKPKTASNIIEKLVYHRHFESASAFIIMLHATFIAFYVESLAAHKGKPPDVWPICNQVLVGVFFVEVVLKMVAERLEYFCGSDKVWNVFDFILIVLVTIELFVTIVTSSLDEHRRVVKKMLKMGEVLRTFRVLRIFRVLRFSHSLSTVISKIFNSIKTLFWVMVLIIMLIFVVAVCFTNGATHYLDDEEIGDVHEVRKNFGSVSRSFLTVFKSVSGGMRWGQAADSLQAMSDFYFLLFLAYIAFTMFAVLNIITGIFVDAALQTAVTERDLIMERQHDLERSSVEHLREVFFDMDEEETGLILMDQFKKSLTDDRVKAFMHSLKINTSDATQLFRLLDTDNSGEILIDEFVEGCMKLRGEAKSMDIHILMCESRRMWTKLASFTEQLCESFQALNKAMSGKSSMLQKPQPIALSLYGSRVASRNASRAGSRRPSVRPSDEATVRAPSQNPSSPPLVPSHSPPSLLTAGAKDSPEAKQLPGSAQLEVETTGILPIGAGRSRGSRGSEDGTGQSTARMKTPHSPKMVPVPSMHPFGLQHDSDTCTKTVSVE